MVAAMKLYSYWRSSASYRVRIALNLKGLPYDIVPVDLLKNGGQQHTAEYRAMNPAALVPTLIDERDAAASSPASAAPLTQSLAIIEYLEEICPQPPLLPSGAVDRAYVRSLALSIACDIHPLNNLRVLRYLTRTVGINEETKDAWYRHWCEQGLAAIESVLAADSRTGTFCYADAPGVADCCLIPQVANAERFHCDLSAMPTVLRINQACLALDSFVRAAPANQLDAG